MPRRESETDRIRRIYDRRAATPPQSHNDAGLHWLCSRAEGETLEIGIGRGRTLPYYPRDVHLTGLDLSEVSLAAATRRARELGLGAVLLPGDAAALPFPDEHFDTVVFSYALCTIPDDRAAVAEAVRVLRPDGCLLLLEHVRSPNRAVLALEHLLEPLTMWRMADHLLREPLTHVQAEGLEIEELERHWFGAVERLAARKADSQELAETG
jgi:ubiquinone/menaquinone biosynthesis C-methylase UbiE